MKILWVSDSPTFLGSYGIQTKLIASRLQQAGHDITIFATTYAGEPIELEGMTVIGNPGDLYGNDVLPDYATKLEPDIILTMKDVWAYQPWMLRSLPRPWVPCVPLDTEPAARVIIDRLIYAMQALVFTPNGQALLADQGIEALLTPHGIDRSIFKPGDKKAAREALDLPVDDFLMLVVANNNDNNEVSRKSLDSVLLAYAVFLEHHKDCLLYMLTDMTTERGGLDLMLLGNVLGISDTYLRAPGRADYRMGIPAEKLALYYQAADVLVNPATGGAFEIPLVEAQACGTPVIACNWTGMRDTIWSGVKLSTEIGGKADGEPVWCPLGGFRFRPYVSRIRNAMEWAYANRDNEQLRRAALSCGEHYDIDYVVETYWLPAMRLIEDLMDAKIGSRYEDYLEEAAAKLEENA